MSMAFLPLRRHAAMRGWGFVDAADPSSASELERLGAELSSFYSGQAQKSRYWERVDDENAVWDPKKHPFHCHLASQILAGSTVVDFGCGSAHAARNLDPSVHYIGLEGSPSQVEINRQRFPNARFIQGDMLAPHGLDGVADWAVTFFAIEHCVRPDILLRRMLETVRPGGRIAIMCPNFARGMHSLRSGWSAYSKRDKLRQLRLLDVLVSYVEERWLWPSRVATVHQSSMQFPIYLRPRCFDAPYFSDSDAVYLVTERRLRESLVALGCTIETSTRSIPEDSGLSEALIYIVAVKPSA